MLQHSTVTVLAIDKDYGYTIIEVCAPNREPASFAVKYDSVTNRYELDQSGENNFWSMAPDERK